MIIHNSYHSKKQTNKQTKKNPTIIIGEFLVLYSMHILFYGGLGHVVLIDSLWSPGFHLQYCSLRIFPYHKKIWNYL